MTDEPLWLDANAGSDIIGAKPPLAWRSKVKKTGAALWKSIFAAHPKVLGAYREALGMVERNHSLLHLRLKASRQFLNEPIETCFEPSEGYHLVQRHPLARRVDDAPVTRLSPSPQFFDDLQRRSEALRILLIGSNTCPPIPGVDTEIDDLANSLEEPFETARNADRGHILAHRRGHQFQGGGPVERLSLSHRALRRSWHVSTRLTRADLFVVLGKTGA